MTVFPSMVTGSETVASKRSPGLLSSLATAWSSVTWIGVPSGTVTASSFDRLCRVAAATPSMTASDTTPPTIKEFLVTIMNASVMNLEADGFPAAANVNASKHAGCIFVPQDNKEIISQGGNL